MEFLSFIFVIIITDPIKYIYTLSSTSLRTLIILLASCKIMTTRNELRTACEIIKFISFSCLDGDTSKRNFG